VYALVMWNQLSDGWKEEVVDRAAQTRAALLQVWLFVIGVFTVWVDPMGWARRPILSLFGRHHPDRVVCFTRAETEHQLRTVSYFWRNPHDKTLQSLHDALVRFCPRNEPHHSLKVAGVLSTQNPDAEDPANSEVFTLHIDFLKKVYSVSHVITEWDGPTSGSLRICTHDSLPVVMSSAALPDLINSLWKCTACSNPAKAAHAGRSKTD